MGSRARSVYVPGRPATVADTRTSPSTESQIASSDVVGPVGPHVAQQLDGVVAFDGAAVLDPRATGTRPGSARRSSSSTASSERALFTWSSTSKSLARSGHGRTCASSGGTRVHEPAAHPPAAGRLAVEGEEVVVERRAGDRARGRRRPTARRDLDPRAAVRR